MVATIPDWELWACAAAVEQQHGEQAPMFVAQRLGALALVGDADGIATWQRIAGRLDALRRPPATT